MKKIPTLFIRSETNRSPVTTQVTPGCEWVLEGLGQSTVKWDGTCCLIREGVLYKRYDAKHGKTPPPGWIPAQPEADPISGHWPGWLQVGSGPDDRWHLEGLANTGCGNRENWTYELLGPKVQGNPYGFPVHILAPHGADVIEAPRDFDGLRAFFEAHAIEGIVWWRDLEDPDCDKVKLKRKDLGLAWPPARRS